MLLGEGGTSGLRRSGTDLNGVAFTYDGWGNLIQSIQDPDAAAGSGDPDVKYDYEEYGSGDDKNVRLQYIT